MRRHHAMSIGFLSVLALVVALATPSTVHGQGDTCAFFGQSVYGMEGDLCLSSEALITVYRGCFNFDSFGVSVAFINNDYPWPPTGEGDGAAFSSTARLSYAQQDFALTRGNSIQLVAEFFPMDYFDFMDRVSLNLRPFVGAGVQFTRDGDPDPNPGGVPIFAVLGSTDGLASVGAIGYFPSRNSRVRFQAQYRVTRLFPSDFTLESPTGAETTIDGKALTWGELTFGVSIRR